MRDGKLWSVLNSRQAAEAQQHAGSLAQLAACKLPLELPAAPLADNQHAGHVVGLSGDITRQGLIDVYVPQAGTYNAVQPQQHPQVQGTLAGDQQMVRPSTDSNDTPAVHDAQQLLQAGAVASAGRCRQPDMGSWDHHISTELLSAAIAAAGTAPAPQADIAWPQHAAVVVQPMAGSNRPQAGAIFGHAEQGDAQMLQHQGEYHAVAPVFPGAGAGRAAASPTVPRSAASSSVDTLPQHKALLPPSAAAGASGSAGSAAAAVAAATAALQAAAQARSASSAGAGRSPAASRAPGQFALLDKFLSKQQLAQVTLLHTPTNVNTVYVPRTELLAFIAIQQWVQQHLGLPLPLLDGSFVLVHTNNLHAVHNTAGAVLQQDASHTQDGSSSSLQHTNSPRAMAAAIPWRLRQVSAVEVAPSGDPADATVVLVGGDRVAAGQVGPLQQDNGHMYGDEPAQLQDVVDYQYLCCELAAQQAAGTLGSFRVHDVAHVAWRMKLATELETMIEQHKQEQAALVAAGDEELVEGAHQASLINVRGTLARLPPMDWVDGQILQYIELNPLVWPEAPGQPWTQLSTEQHTQLLQGAAAAWQHYVQQKLAGQQPQPATDFVPWQPLAADEQNDTQQQHAAAEPVTAQESAQTQVLQGRHQPGQLQQLQDSQQRMDLQRQQPQQQQSEHQQQPQQQPTPQYQQQQAAVPDSQHLQQSATALAINLISGGGVALDDKFTAFDDDEFLDDLFAPAHNMQNPGSSSFPAGPMHGEQSNGPQQPPADAAAGHNSSEAGADWGLWTQRGDACAATGGGTRSPRVGRGRFEDRVLGRSDMQDRAAGRGRSPPLRSWRSRDFESGRGGGRRGHSFMHRSAHLREAAESYGPRYGGRREDDRDGDRQRSSASPERRLGQYMMVGRGRAGADSPPGRRGRERPVGSSPGRDSSRGRPSMRRVSSRSRTRSPACSPHGRAGAAAGGLSGRSDRRRSFVEGLQRSPTRVRRDLSDSRRGSSPDRSRRGRGVAAEGQDDGPYSMFRHRDASLSSPPRRALPALAPPEYTGVVDQDTQIWLKHLAVLLAPVRLSRPNSMTLYELRETLPMPPSAKKFYGGIFSFLDAQPALTYFELEPSTTTRRTHSLHFVPRYHEELLAAVQQEQDRTAAAAGREGPGSYQQQRQQPATLREPGMFPPAAVSSPRAGGRAFCTPSAEPADPVSNPAVIERFTRPWLLHLAEWLSHPKHAGHPSAALSALEERLPLPPVVLQHYGSMARFVTARPELDWARPSRDGYHREVQIAPRFCADLAAAAEKAKAERIAAKQALREARRAQPAEQLQAASQQQEEEGQQHRAARYMPGVSAPVEAVQQQQRQQAERGPDMQVRESGSRPSKAAGGAAVEAAADPAPKRGARERTSTAAAPPAAAAAGSGLRQQPQEQQQQRMPAKADKASAAAAADGDGGVQDSPQRESKRRCRSSRSPQREAGSLPSTAVGRDLSGNAGTTAPVEVGQQERLRVEAAAAAAGMGPTPAAAPHQQQKEWQAGGGSGSIPRAPRAVQAALQTWLYQLAELVQPGPPPVGRIRISRLEQQLPVPEAVLQHYGNIDAVVEAIPALGMYRGMTHGGTIVFDEQQHRRLRVEAAAAAAAAAGNELFAGAGETVSSPASKRRRSLDAADGGADGGLLGTQDVWEHVEGEEEGAAGQPAPQPAARERSSTATATPAAAATATGAQQQPQEEQQQRRPAKGDIAPTAIAPDGDGRQQQQEQRRSAKADKASAAADADGDGRVHESLERDSKRRRRSSSSHQRQDKHRRSSSSQGNKSGRQRSRSRSTDRPSKKRPSSSNGRDNHRGKEDTKVSSKDKAPSGKDKSSKDRPPSGKDRTSSKGVSRSSSSKRKASEAVADDSKRSRSAAAAADRKGSREPADSATASEGPSRRPSSAAAGSKQQGRGEAGRRAEPRGPYVLEPSADSGPEPLSRSQGPEFGPPWGGSMRPPPPHGWPDDRDSYGGMVPPPPMGNGEEWWEPVPLGPHPGMRGYREDAYGPGSYDRMMGPGAGAPGGGMRGYHNDGPGDYDRMMPPYEPMGPGGGGARDGMRGHYEDGPGPYDSRMPPPRHRSPEPVGGPGLGPGRGGMQRFRSSDAALDEFGSNLHRKFVLMKPGAVLNMRSAGELMPRDLAQHVCHAKGLTVQRVVTENLAGWEVVREATGAEVVRQAPQPRQLQRQRVCKLWVPEKGGGCHHMGQCDFKHALPEVLWNI